MRNIIIGTTNPEKVEDVILALNSYCPSIIAKKNKNIITLSDIRESYDISEASEDGKTVEENAISKLIFYKNEIGKLGEYNGDLLISEDTGLFIRSLDWSPGVHTARFAGDHDFKKLGLKVMELMDGVNDRFAFVKSSVGATIIGEGEYTTILKSNVMYGSISSYIYEGSGFDFDKIFCRREEYITFAETCNKSKLSRLELPRSVCLDSIFSDTEWSGNLSRF